MIYRFKATFNAAKDFFRNYDLLGNNTLYDLHEHIVNDLHFAPDQLVTFIVKNDAGKAIKKYGLFDTGNGSMDTITIEKIMRTKEITLFYVFNMNDNRSLRLTFTETDDELPRKSYPRTSDEKGDAPLQFMGNKTDYSDDFE